MTEGADGPLNRSRVRREVEAAFGGDLFPALRNEGCLVGLHVQGDIDHLGRRRHLQVQSSPDDVAEKAKVPVLDMPPVFPKVDGDSVGPSQLCQNGGGGGVGLGGPAGLADSRDVIEIDTEAH